MDILKLLTETQIKDLATDKMVDARFKAIDPDLCNLRLDDVWWCGLSCRSGVFTRNQPDRHWVWSNFLEAYQKTRTTVRCLAMTVLGGSDIEAATIYDINGASLLEPGERCIYVELIATHPHNRSELVDSARYRETAYRTINRLIVESYLLKAKGRISLNAVQTTAAIKFYTDLGFVNAGLVKNRLQPMELPQTEAYNILRKLGVAP